MQVWGGIEESEELLKACSIDGAHGYGLYVDDF